MAGQGGGRASVQKAKPPNFLIRGGFCFLDTFFREQGETYCATAQTVAQYVWVPLRVP
mgnify:CR=1 FL=1